MAATQRQEPREQFSDVGWRLNNLYWVINQEGQGGC